MHIITDTTKLHAVCEAWEGTTEEARQLAEEMAEIMMRQNGIGLAAPQLGINKRVFVFGNPQDKESIRAVFNPEIVFYSDETEVSKEGCLSFPLLFLTVRRSKNIRIRYTNINGERVTERYSGLTARVVQHEFDHLDGITFDKRVSRYSLQKSEKKRKILKRRVNIK